MLEIARTVGLDHLQLHGDESPATVARLGRSLRGDQGGARAEIVSARRSSRVQARQRDPARWLRSQRARRNGQDVRLADRARAKRHGRIFLAGGLTPENVGEAIRAARPYAVDVCSGVEAKPGKKDPERMRSSDARGRRRTRKEDGAMSSTANVVPESAAATARTAAATSRKR